MPTYEYKCKDCGFELEEFQSITDDPLKVCPSCGGELQRVLSGGIGLIFKGSGFYITDYAKKNSSTHSKPSGDAAAKTNGKKSDSASKEKTKHDTKKAER